MKDYYLFQNANIEADETTLTVRSDALRRIPVEQVEGLHLLAGYSLTSGVFNLASKHNFPIHFYAYRGGYSGSYLPGPVDRTTLTLKRQVLENDDHNLRLARALEILQAARAAMDRLLQPFDLCIPDYGDVRGLEELRLQEARIRKEYYALLDTLLPPYWSIVRRARRPPRRPADALLGFLNGILYAKVCGWVHRAGLDPRIGYVHGDARAANPLALDLAEILKPALSEGLLLELAASGQERSLVTRVGEGTYLNEKGRRAALTLLEEVLARQTDVGLFDRAFSVGRIGELVPVKLHRAVIAGEPARYPVPTCTLSSSTMQTLEQERTYVDSSSDSSTESKTASGPAT